MKENMNTYGYNSFEYAKFKEYAWKMLLSFALLYLFFYNAQMALPSPFSLLITPNIPSSPQFTQCTI